MTFEWIENPFVHLAVMSMLPISELRGGIIYAAAQGLPFATAYPLAVAANLLPVPFLILFSRQILGWLSRQKYVGGFFERYLRSAGEKAKKIGKYELVGLCLFVAVPLPITGAWTGSVIAAMLQLRMRWAVLAIAIGICISGVIMGVLSYGASEIFKQLV